MLESKQMVHMEFLIKFWFYGGLNRKTQLLLKFSDIGLSKHAYFEKSRPFYNFKRTVP